MRLFDSRFAQSRVIDPGADHRWATATGSVPEIRGDGGAFAVGGELFLPVLPQWKIAVGMDRFQCYYKVTQDSCRSLVDGP